MGRIRIAIVDDSAFMRHALGRLLSEVPDFEVVGAASDGREGLRLAAECRPDVITLDVEMPVLDGLGMLRRLMLENPTRAVMLSSRTTEDAQTTLDALELGAIDFVPKPPGPLAIDIGRVGEELIAKIRAAAGMSDASFLRHRQVAAMNLTLIRDQLHPVRARPDESGSPTGAAQVAKAGPVRVADKLVIVAASTGGPGALRVVVKGLPADLGAAVAIIQHMPPGFTTSLAARLDALGQVPCKEAAADDLMAENRILLAPGDLHMICATSGRIRLARLPAVNGLRPAADVTLQAVAPIWRERLLCVVLTGMGCDARDGARAVKEHGGTVISQDAATSTIYGMPAAVAAAGLTDRVLPLQQIAAEIAGWCRRRDSDSRRAEPRSRSARRSDRPALAS
jgi:two-component system chemotaxis response regulator CheB